MAATTVIASYIKPDGTPEMGYVEFSLTVPAYQDTLDKTVTRTPVRAELDEAGHISVDLEPTSGADSDFVVTGLSYKVVETFTDVRGKKLYSRKYYVDVPSSVADVDLGDISAWASAPSPELLRLQHGITSARPSAATLGPGGIWYDETLGLPIFSDGNDWRDAAGNIV
jgi:hypothetical protein